MIIFIVVHRIPIYDDICNTNNKATLDNNSLSIFKRTDQTAKPLSLHDRKQLNRGHNSRETVEKTLASVNGGYKMEMAIGCGRE